MNKLKLSFLFLFISFLTIVSCKKDNINSKKSIELKQAITNKNLMKVIDNSYLEDIYLFSKNIHNDFLNETLNALEQEIIVSGDIESFRAFDSVYFIQFYTSSEINTLHNNIYPDLTYNISPQLETNIDDYIQSENDSVNALYLWMKGMAEDQISPEDFESFVIDRLNEISNNLNYTQEEIEFIASILGASVGSYIYWHDPTVINNWADFHKHPYHYILDRGLDMFLQDCRGASWGGLLTKSPWGALGGAAVFSALEAAS